MKFTAAISWIIVLIWALGFEQSFCAPIPHKSLGIQVRDETVNIVTRGFAVSPFAKRDMGTTSVAAPRMDAKSTFMRKVVEGLSKFFHRMKEWTISKAENLKELGRRFGAWFKRVKSRIAGKRIDPATNPELQAPTISSVDSTEINLLTSGTSAPGVTPGALVLSSATRDPMLAVPIPSVNINIKAADTPGVSGTLNRFVPMMRGGLNSQEDVENACAYAALGGLNCDPGDGSTPSTPSQPQREVPPVGSRPQPVPETPEPDALRAPVSKAGDVLRIAEERAASGKLAKEPAATKKLTNEQAAAEELMRNLDSEYEGPLEDDRTQDSRSGFEGLAKTEYERQALNPPPVIPANYQDSKQIDQTAREKAEQEQAASAREENASKQLQVPRIQATSNEPVKAQPARDKAVVRFPAFEREVEKAELRMELERKQTQIEREKEREMFFKEYRKDLPSRYPKFSKLLKNPNLPHKMADDQLAEDQLAKDQLAKDQLAKDQLAAEERIKTLDSEYEGVFEGDQNQDNRSGLEQLVKGENDMLKELGPDHRSPMTSESGPPRGTNGVFAQTQKQLKELESIGYDYLEVPKLKSLERANPNYLDPLDAVFIDQGIDPMKVSLKERRLYAIIFEWYRQNKAPHDIHHPQHHELYDATRDPLPDSDGNRNLWGTELYHEQMSRPAPIPYLREQMKGASTFEKLGNLFKFGFYSNDPNRPLYWFHKWIPGLDRSRELEDWIDGNIPSSWIEKNFPTKAGPSTSRRYSSEIDPTNKKDLVDKYNENYKEAADLHNWIEADNFQWLSQAAAVDKTFHKGGDVIEAMESVPSTETLLENPKVWRKMLRKTLGAQPQYNELHRTQYEQDVALDRLHERLRDNDVVVQESKPMEKFPW